MRRAAGFTLKEVLIVLAMIGVIDCTLLVTISKGKRRPSWQVISARQWMSYLNSAVEAYHRDAGSYPPDTDPLGRLNSAEVLNKALTGTVTVGTKTFGPYISAGIYSKDVNGNGVSELCSPLGAAYEYKILLDAYGKPRGFLVVDPGPDQKLGGKLDAKRGFVKDKVPANPADPTDDTDNIYSNDSNLDSRE